MVTKQKHPTKEECMMLWEKYETPAHIRKHCEAVALTACAIAEKLIERGYSLDKDLVYAAGMLHDIVRLAKDHEKEGAAIMRQLGYEQEAQIIEVHMHYDPFSPIESVNETDMVCLGDRSVIEDHFVGIDRRYQHIIDKAIRLGRPEAEPFIIEKKKDVVRFVAELEEVTGMTLEEMAGDIKIG